MNSAIQAANDQMVYLSGDEGAIRAYEVRFKAACDLTSDRGRKTLSSKQPYLL